MTKKELKNLTLPLSQETFQKIKEMFDNDQINRPDLPVDVLLEVDRMWAEMLDEQYWKLRESGVFGAFD